jgi:hypothetical protein
VRRGRRPRERVNAYRSGAAIDKVLISDLERLDLGRCHVVVFPSAFCLTQARRRFIAERVARKGRMLVWVYAPGYTDVAGPDATSLGNYGGGQGVGSAVLCVHSQAGGQRTLALSDGRKIEINLRPRSTVPVDRVSGKPVMEP